MLTKYSSATSIKSYLAWNSAGCIFMMYAADSANHKQPLKLVISRLSQNSLKLNLAKCVLGKPSVRFLRYHKTLAGVKLLPQKVQSITKFSKPKTVA